MKKNGFLLSLLLATSLHAHGPDLRIVRGGDYGETLKGLTGRGWMSSLSVFEWSAAGIPDDLQLKEPTITNSVRRLMYFYLDVVNLGDEGFGVGNVFANPERFAYRNGRVYVRGLWGASITDTNGNVVRERIGEWLPAWDGFSALAGVPTQYSYFAPGISPAHAATTTDPTQDGCLIDVTGLPPAKYLLTVTLNPAGWYPITPRMEMVEFTLNGFDARLWPPPAAATPAAATPPPTPLGAAKPEVK